MIKTDKEFKEFITRRKEVEKKFKHLTKEEAELLCKKESIKCRIVREDEINYIVTQDYVPDRLNFQIDSGLITEINFG